MRNDSKMYELCDIQDKSQIFNVIINDNKHPLYWGEIIQLFIDVDKIHSTFYGEFKKTIVSAKDLDFLENRGIDYNYIDAGGNNFLHYVFALYNNPASSNNITFYESAIDYIISKTANIYHLNNANKNILFNLLSYRSGGVQGENFIKFVSTYPDFDLNQMDKNGNNLLNYAIGNFSPTPLSLFLINNKVSCTHLDSDNQNLLNLFATSYMHYEPQRVDLFNYLLLHNDITNISKFGDSCFSYWLDNYYDNTGKKELKKSCSLWIQNLCTQISKAELLMSPLICKNLIELLEKNQKKYTKSVLAFAPKYLQQDILNKYTDALKGLQYIKLNYDLIVNPNSSKTKLKI